MVRYLLGRVFESGRIILLSREMVARTPDVLLQKRLILGDGWSIIFMSDPWIANLPLVWWPTFITMDISDSISISDLLTTDGIQWNPVIVTQIFRDILGARFLSIILHVIHVVI